MQKLSSRDSALLPAPDALKRLCQSLAILDAMIAPEWSARYVSFRARWSEREATASFHDGSGDGLFVLFGPAGTTLAGFAQNTPMASYSLTHGRSWPGVLDPLPQQEREVVRECLPQGATFCLWHGISAPEWTLGPVTFPPGSDPDGSESLLALLDGNPATYQAWAQEYYETRLDLDAVARIYRHEPLSNDLIAQFGSQASLHSLAGDLEEIGYPRA